MKISPRNLNRSYKNTSYADVKLEPKYLSEGFYRQSTNVSVVNTMKQEISKGHGVPLLVVRDLHKFK